MTTHKLAHMIEPNKEKEKPISEELKPTLRNKTVLLMEKKHPKKISAND